MKKRESIIGTSGAVFIGLGLTTMFADSIWEDEYHDAPEIPVGTHPPHRDGREKIACASCHVIKISNVPPPIAVNASVPVSHLDGRDQWACKICHVIQSPK